VDFTICCCDVINICKNIYIYKSLLWWRGNFPSKYSPCLKCNPRVHTTFKIITVTTKNGKGTNTNTKPWTELYKLWTNWPWCTKPCTPTYLCLKFIVIVFWAKDLKNIYSDPKKLWPWYIVDLHPYSGIITPDSVKLRIFICRLQPFVVNWHGNLTSNHAFSQDEELERQFFLDRLHPDRKGLIKIISTRY
jgi:hypothetical protein